MDPLLGQQIGQYKIEAIIGKGGMATVYKAYQPSIARYVAIKVLADKYAKDASFVKRFEGEARAVAALEHPNILAVYDFGSQDGMLYMVMRLIEGGTLAERIYSDPPLTFAEIVKITGGVASALDFAHNNGIIHRDVKPSNVMIDRHGSVLLMDFGLAKAVEAGVQSRLTQTGTVVGTATYMSPEQAADEPLDGRSDVYSLGVMLFEMLVGHPPFDADTMVAIALKHINEPTPSLRAINPDIPEPFERVVFKAMEKWADDRYQTAAALSEELQKALHEMDTQTQIKSMVRSTPVERQPRTDTASALRRKYGSGPRPTAVESPTAPLPKPASGSVDVAKPPWLWGSMIAAVLTTVAVIAFFLWLAGPAVESLEPPEAGPPAGTAILAFENSVLDSIPNVDKDGIITRLGLPKPNGQYPRSNHSHQPFEKGLMFWWENPAVELDPIYVIYHTGNDDAQGDDWSQYKNTWTVDEPEVPDFCLEASGEYGPIKGFGRLWCYNESVQTQMGRPTAAEVGSNDATIEFYEGGIAFSIPDDSVVYVLLYNDGTWGKYPMQ